MDKNELRQLLQDIRDGCVDVEQAESRIQHLAYSDLGYAKIDHHRGLRGHSNEVIYCEGKQISHIVGIVDDMLARGAENIMATRASPEVHTALCGITNDLTYHDLARIVLVKPRQHTKTQNTILILCAGTSDIPIAEEAAVTAETLGNPVNRVYDVGVAGLHRLLAHLQDIQDANVIVTIAGMEGALASVVGGLTDKPVIAVPTSIGYGASFGGLAALLAMLNSCASGIGVVNINNGFGAGYLASKINQL